MKPLLNNPCCIAHTFQAVAALHPQSTAIIHASPSTSLAGDFSTGDFSLAGDVSYTFEELAGAVDSLSHRLRRNGDSGKVGIWMGQSVEYLVSVLAVLKVGGVFIPMDPSWPVGRLQSVLQSAQPAVILACRHTFWSPQSFVQAKIGALEAAECRLWWLPEGFVKNGKMENACEDGDVRCGRTSFCYILYTSGSSGTPKGVCGTDQGLMNRISWMESTYPHGSADVGCFKTSIGFVDHLTEALGTLLAGVPLVIPSPEILKGNLLTLLSYIENYKITRLTAVPSIFRALLPALQADRRHAADSLRILSLSGESLSLKLLKDLHSICGHTTILNLYGSTEVSGDSSCFDCTSLRDPSSTRMQALKRNGFMSTPIGDPISGCFHWIIVDGSRLAGVNEEGELWVGGVGVARSYLNDHDSTMRKFIDLNDEADSIQFYRELKEVMVEKAQFRDSDNRVFRTGDTAKQLSDGTVVLLGRLDRQVKIRGNRMALEEIEANLEMNPKVSRCVVVMHGEATLVAFVVRKSASTVIESAPLTDEDSEDLSQEFKIWLEKSLPAVMVPQIFIPVESLALNDSGKTDTGALLKLIRGSDDAANLIRNPLVEQGLPGIDEIQQVLARVLKVEILSNTDDFFSRGGTSISAAHAAHILDVDMRLLYMYPSATLLYKAIQGRSNIILGDPVSSQRQGYQPSAYSSIEIAKDIVHPKLSSDQESRKRKLDQCGIVSRRATKDDRWTWNSSNWTGVSLGFCRCNRTVVLRSLPEESPSTSEGNVLSESEAAKDVRSLKLCWKVSLQACVDASPLVVMHGGDLRVFIGSHSHNFLCLDATSGKLQWEATFGGRVESSAAVTQDVSQVVVGCYDGFIYFLDFWSGQKLWSFKTAGEVKCQPALDPWTGLIWCGSHDHHIYALDSISHSCVWRHDCGGSIFGSPAFNKSNNTAYVGTTRGTVLAIQIQPTIHVVWSYECGAPIFGSLAVDSSTEHVICTSVSGGVTALKSDGIPAWQVAMAAWSLPVKTNGSIFAGATISPALVSQVLVTSGDSHLYCLNLQDGHVIWKHEFGGPITSSAYVEEEPVLSQDCNDVHVAERLICVATTAGNVHVLFAPTAIASRVSENIFSKLLHGRRSLPNFELAEFEKILWFLESEDMNSEQALHRKYSHQLTTKAGDKLNMY